MRSDKPVFAIRFRTPDAGKIATAYGGNTSEAARRVQEITGSSGRIVQASPFTGNGFTASSNHVIPEFHADKFIDLEDGAEMFQILPNGEEVPFAVFDKELRRFRFIDNQ